MKSRVANIGTGWVGATVAKTTHHTGNADELLFYDRRSDVAEGEAMDLGHGAAFYASATVRTASIEEMAQADVVVVTAGRGGKANESRLDLLRDNAAVIRDIGERLRGATGLIVVVSNPVDVLTRVMTEASGLPPARVVGTGTMLDTARLRQTLGHVLNVDSHSVHAQVVGEHGDSSVVLWSSAAVGGVHVRDWPGWDRQAETRIADDVRRAAYEIIRRKGSTNHAIGIVTATLMRSMLRSERRIHTVSRVQEGAFGVHDVALSLPAIVSAAGASVIVEPDLNADERTALEHSASVLRKAAASLS
jgi:L-lactate dehydrogenase